MVTLRRKASSFGENHLTDIPAAKNSDDLVPADFAR
jgi:hypothetical protein